MFGLRRAFERFRARVGGPQREGITRRSLFGLIAAAPLVPTAAEITAKALAAVPAKPSGEIILPAGSKIDITLRGGLGGLGVYPPAFTIPPQPPFLSPGKWAFASDAWMERIPANGARAAQELPPEAK
jgi:hypothetical protein